jgi:FkbM family methyltransferase
MSHIDPTDDHRDASGQSSVWDPVEIGPGGVLSQAKKCVRRSFRRLGYDVRRYRGEGESYEARRCRIMRLHEVDLVLDVGANVGQYAIGLRHLGYRGRIVSFEPLQAAFAQLKAQAAGDPSWQCVKTALGESCGEAVIHVAGNSVSSSLLPMAGLHAEMFPESTYVGDEDVPIAPLQTVAADFLTGDERILLKMDVQGYELAVLRGSEGLLDAVSVIEAEMSTRELYEGQPLWWEIVQFLADRDYLLSIAHELIVNADTGCLVQLDGVFVRPSVA